MSGRCRTWRFHLRVSSDTSRGVMRPIFDHLCVLCISRACCSVRWKHYATALVVVTSVKKRELYFDCMRVRKTAGQHSTRAIPEHMQILARVSLNNSLLAALALETEHDFLAYSSGSLTCLHAWKRCRVSTRLCWLSVSCCRSFTSSASRATNACSIHKTL